ncbi:MAG: DUF3179 domain-containing protein [Alphaproteobacteria bacterium]|nr:MAG: DUF3179 domain-containing protein [Alphaproteobacteria bacterium]
MRRLPILFLALAISATSAALAAGVPRDWQRAWPETDFTKHSIDYDEILEGGPPKDGIPSIDRPQFESIEKAARWLSDRSPVIGVEIAGEARAYPLGILIRHEIVNDRIGDVPVAITYCPLCNAAIVFRREANGRELDFGTTGKLRNSDLVMYDRQTESWWQQFTGTAIVGTFLGTKLERLPARLESFADFRARAPEGRVLARPVNRSGVPYGVNPYRGYDSAPRPFLYDGSLPRDVPPLSRVVSVGDRAWALSLVRKKGRIETGDGLVITWKPGQASALDAFEIGNARDVGTVLVQKRTDDGLADIPYGVDFAFAFHAFHPESQIVTALD